MISMSLIAAAATVLLTTQAGAQSPPWSERLFPFVGTPDQYEHRLSRSEAREVQVDGKPVGVVTAKLICRNMDGHEETAQARIYLPPVLLNGGKAPACPLIYNAGYEIDENGATHLAAKGYVVCTPHAHPLHPLVRGPNVDIALLHAARAISWIDPLRVCIQGGSAGGWMTLLLTAESFPILWSAPDVPPIHWGYNAGYLRANLEVAGPPAGSTSPRMPYLYGVSQIADPSMKGLGTSFDSPSALAISPIAHLDTITAPVQTYFSTADVLVPINQVSRALVKPHDPTVIPAEYDSNMYDRYASIRGKRTLLDALPRSAYQLFPVMAPDGMPRVPAVNQAANGKAGHIDLPFTKSKLWSIVVVDEGSPDSQCAHTKYLWGADHDPFKHWAESRGITADQLTAPKLQRLMKRMLGEPWRKMETRPHEGKTINRRELMDFPAAEKADVVRGLQAYALDDARAIRLAELYSRLPERLKVLGSHLGDGTAAGVREELKSSDRSGL